MGMMGQLGIMAFSIWGKLTNGEFKKRDGNFLRVVYRYPVGFPPFFQGSKEYKFYRNFSGFSGGCLGFFPTKNPN